MDPAQEQKIRQVVEEGVKNSLRMHFKMLQSIAKQLDDPALGIPKAELYDVKLGAQSEITAQLYIWTYLNMCVENGDLDILCRAWENPQFRAKALVSAIQLIHRLCQGIVNQFPLQVPQEHSLNTPIVDN